jgi:serine/threonine protein kinase
MPLALRTYASWIAGARGAPQERLSHYALFGKQEAGSRAAGSRAEVYFGLGPDASDLSEVEVVKVFLPPTPGAALDGLTEELALASKLAHENIVRTSNVGFDAGRYFLVNEHLEGVTLDALLAWTTWAGVKMADAAVARVLLALVAAVEHAQGLAGSVSARSLIHQPISAADVYVTYDGSVKLLGFKNRAGGKVEASVPAVDALLSQHLTHEVGMVLAQASAAVGNSASSVNSASSASSANSSSESGSARIRRFAQALQTWQVDNGTDGAGELALLMATAFGPVRREQRTRLEAAAAEALRSRQERQSLIINVGDELAPVSSFRRILG